jgi:signal transduction histidine kinase
VVLDEARLVDGLLALAQHLSSGADLGVCLTGLCRAVTELTGCRRSSIFLLAGEHYELRYGFGELPDGPMRASKVQAQDETIAEAVRSRGCVVTRNPQHLQRFDATAASTGVQSLAVAPLLDEAQQPLGVLTAEYTETADTFSDVTARLVLGMAKLAAMAVLSERRNRERLYRTQQEEAQVDAALARVGRELIVSLNTSSLLERLCRLTTEVLSCDYSTTMLRHAEENAYVLAACYSATTQEREAVPVVKLSQDTISEFLGQLERDELVQVSAPSLEPGAAARLTVGDGISVSIHAALRRESEVVGFHSAGYRGRHEPFTVQQLRVARGIAQLASLALETARVIEGLERASNLKSEFLATMSHELRSPLNIILGYADLLLEHAYGRLSPEQADTLRRMEKSARELLELINATLDLSRLEAGRMTLEVRATHVPDLIREIDFETHPLREKPGVDFVCHLAPSLPVLHTDPLKLKVVLKNLVLNALKFTDKGSVMVDVYCRDDGVEFCVADTGIGMAPEVVPIIFEPFRQAGNSRTRRQSGVGLGLYIVRRLLDMLGGAISVDSELGRGSIFRVWVPNLAQPGT